MTTDHQSRADGSTGADLPPTPSAISRVAPSGRDSGHSLALPQQPTEQAQHEATAQARQACTALLGLLEQLNWHASAEALRDLLALTAATAQQADELKRLELARADESMSRIAAEELVAQQADEIARLTAVVDSLRELQHQDEDRLAARDAEIARLKAALGELSGDESEDWRYPNTANLRRAARAALSEGTRT